MSLYEDWLRTAYNEKGENITKVWDDYLPLEQKIYEEILKNKITNVEGTVKELAARFHMSIEYICGFIDGINEAIKESIDIENISEDTFVKLEIDFESLYKKMVEYKAEHLYHLPEWNSVFTEDERAAFFKEQKNSGTVRREGDKIGRNDPCSCGSGKKYKKCCGAK